MGNVFRAGGGCRREICIFGHRKKPEEQKEKGRQEKEAEGGTIGGGGQKGLGEVKLGIKVTRTAGKMIRALKKRTLAG
jgi:hypothetical protein